MIGMWKPSVTVAAIIERDGRFLLVDEETSDGKSAPRSLLYTHSSALGVMHG